VEAIVATRSFLSLEQDRGSTNRDRIQVEGAISVLEDCVSVPRFGLLCAFARISDDVDGGTKAENMHMLSLVWYLLTSKCPVHQSLPKFHDGNSQNRTRSLSINPCFRPFSTPNQTSYPRTHTLPSKDNIRYQNNQLHFLQYVFQR
jgi:hypothetical protein